MPWSTSRPPPERSPPRNPKLGVPRGPVPPDLETRLRHGEPLGVLFDANVLLDVFLQRASAVPAARALTFAEAGAVRGHVCASAFGVIATMALSREREEADVNASSPPNSCGFWESCR